MCSALFLRLYLAHLKVAHQNDVQLLSGVIKRNYARFAKIVRMLRNRKDIRVITDKAIDFTCKYYTLFMSIHHICVHLSMSTNIGMFLCNITEHVRYISEVRSFLVGLILFLLPCFHHYEQNYVVQSCLLYYWQWWASKLQWVSGFLHTPQYSHFFLYWLSQFLMTMFKNISRNFPFSSFDRFPDSIPIKRI